MVIAIDGPAGAGKSTIARRVAERLGFTYIDSGAMYRAVALWALRQALDPSDMHRMEQLALASDIELEPGSQRVRLNGEDVSEAIRVAEVGNAASRVAVIPAVRRALVDKQREMGRRSRVVMEGRDGGFLWFDETVSARTGVRRAELTVEQAQQLDGRSVADVAEAVAVAERALRDGPTSE